MNKKCLAAIKKYYDPDNVSYKKRVYLNWIKANFSGDDIKECTKKVNAKIHTEITRHAKAVTKGTCASGVAVRKPIKPSPPPNPPQRDKNLIYNHETNSYTFNRVRKEQANKYDEIIKRIIEMEK